MESENVAVTVERHTTARVEVVAGITTFLTMAYIIFVNPNILSDAGMDKAALIAVTYYSPHQDFRGLTWELASRTAAAEVQAQCDVVGALSRADAVREALQWWAAQNFLGGLTDAGELMAAWLAFLAAFGVSFFVAWGFSRALMGALARPWQIGATPGQRAGSYRSG